MRHSERCMKHDSEKKDNEGAFVFPSQAPLHTTLVVLGMGQDAVFNCGQILLNESSLFI